MNYRRLCKNGPRVPEIGFGGGPLRGLDWGPVDEETARRTVKRALDLGITFFDTADSYGNGRSERIIGRAVAGRRDETILATKGGWWYVGGEAYVDFSFVYLYRAAEESLRRLRADWIDVYQIHDPDAETIRRGEIFEAMDRLKQEGKVRWTGVSVDTVEEGLLCLRSGRVDLLQVYYNILDQRPDPELFDAARRAGVGIVAKAPLARGLLTGKYRPDSTFPEGDFRGRWQQEKRLDTVLHQVARVQEIVGDRSPSLAQTALRFVLGHPAVSTVIPGAKTPEQVEANAAASAMGPLMGEDLDVLKELYRDGVSTHRWA